MDSWSNDERISICKGVLWARSAAAWRWTRVVISNGAIDWYWRLTLLSHSYWLAWPQGTMIHALNDQTRVMMQSARLLPSLFMTKPKSFNGNWESFTFFSFKTTQFTVGFVCDACVMRNDETIKLDEDDGDGSRSSSQSLLRQPCDLTHAGYTINLTRDNYRKYLPWLHFGIISCPSPAQLCRSLVV